MTNTFTLTNHGLIRLLQYGTNGTYFGLDGATTAESRTATSPVSELTTNGAGRQAIQFTDLSAGNVITCKLKTDYVFTGPLGINAVFLSSAASGTGNMMGRGLLAAVQNVGNEDTVTCELELNIDQV